MLGGALETAFQRRGLGGVGAASSSRTMMQLHGKCLKKGRLIVLRLGCTSGGWHDSDVTLQFGQRIDVFEGLYERVLPCNNLTGRETVIRGIIIEQLGFIDSRYGCRYMKIILPKPLLDSHHFVDTLGLRGMQFMHKWLIIVDFPTP